MVASVNAERSRFPWIVAIAACPVFAVALTLTGLNHDFHQDSTFIVLAVVMIVGYTTVGALIASRRAGGPIGWFMMTVGIGFAFTAATSEYAVYAYRTHPGSPLGAFAAWLNNWAWLPALVPLVLMLVLFPSGRVPSPRWRFLPPAIVALALLGAVTTILRAGRLDIAPGVGIPNPTGVPSLSPVAGVAQSIAGVGLVAAMVASIVALVHRYRRASGDERQQIRWLAYVAIVAGFFFLTGVVASFFVANPNSDPLVNGLFYAFFACTGLGIPGAAGIAILRYRLWDLDLVIRKTVIFALVAAAITALAVVVVLVLPVAVLGTGLTTSERGLLVVGIGLGLLVPPLRRWARRLADRIVYGGRATPYEVLTEFSGRVADTYSMDDFVPRMAAIVGSGTGARAVTVWLRVGRDLRPVASWPDGGATSGDDAHAFEVRHQGEALGAISVVMPANDPMTPNKERLLADLAAQAGLVLRNVRLIEELRESRQRIVAAQDERARKLERNIHDGAQQQLVALAVKLRLAESAIDRDPAKARYLVGQLRTEAQDALETLRDLARGIYPPILADRGLAAAVEAQASKAIVPVRVTAHGLGRYRPDVEAAVYFCALEALQNAVKHARASHVDIGLAAEGGRLRFEVADDGVGFDADAVQGSGLQGMTDRIEAVGGTVAIIATPGGGTRVVGTIEVRAADQDRAPDAVSHAETSRSGAKTAFGM